MENPGIYLVAVKDGTFLLLMSLYIVVSITLMSHSNSLLSVMRAFSTEFVQLIEVCLIRD
jgi:hypothetical protein